ncbi:hypothetical protein HHI36_021183 [Cryptolaemus montrouzieri]|uniref:DDE-1 domain-containing protein n=1 Tax=Cryptolaemus montrouzieri TaxID=559131 RepID=A0ABD2MW54_9CUCU
MDEIGITTVPNKILKVVAVKGKRNINKITYICGKGLTDCLSLLLQRKLFLIEGSPPDSVLFVSDPGYINSQIFMNYLKDFQSYFILSRIWLSPSEYFTTLEPYNAAIRSMLLHYVEYCDQWLVNNENNSQDNVAAIFGQAYNNVCTLEKSVNALRICGIVPVDKFLFSYEDFLPATVTNQGHLEEKEVPQVQNPIMLMTCLFLG